MPDDDEAIKELMRQMERAYRESRKLPKTPCLRKPETRWAYWTGPKGDTGYFPLVCRENLEFRGWSLDPVQPQRKPYPLVKNLP